MTTINKYTDKNGANANAILTSNEQQLASTTPVSTPGGWSFLAFIIALCEGKWFGGFVQGLTQYVHPNMFTLVDTGESGVTVFRPTGSSIFLSVPDPSTVTESERYLCIDSLGSWSNENLYMDLCCFEDIRKTNVEVNVVIDSIQFRLEGYYIQFADVVTISLKIVSLTKPSNMGDTTFYARVTIPNTSIDIPAGCINTQCNWQETPVFFNATLNIPTECNSIDLSFELHNPINTVWGPRTLIHL